MNLRCSTLVLTAPVLALLGCSDPPAPAPQMAAEVRLSPPVAADIGSRTNCTVGSTSTYTFFLGRVTNPPKGTPQDRVVAGTVEDGKGLSVECTVKDAGGGRFTVSASGSGTDANSRHQSLSMTLTDTVTKSGSMTAGAGNFSFYSPDTLGIRTLPEFQGCTVGPVYEIGKGKVLADFTCPIIGDPQSSNSGCQASGTLGVEFCKTGEEED